MKEQIGSLAGKIWLHLKDKEEVALSQISKEVKEKDSLVFQAIGWLAREDKIVYHNKGKRTFVSIVK